MSIFRPFARNLSAALLGLSAISALTFALFASGCGGGSSTSSGGGGGSTPPSTPSTANEWTWMSGSDTENAAGVYGTLGVASASNVPGARTSAASWTDSGGNLWLFGGSGTNGLLNDLWEFSPTTKEWTWVSGSNTGGAVGVYGTEGVASASNVPGARDSAVSWTDSSGNLWLFGGGQFENDLWEFSPTIKEWTWVSGSDTAGASGIYGTLGVPSTGNVPGGRWGSVSWTDSGGNFWLFGGEGIGGSGTNGLLNDLWEFNPSSKEWTWISGSSTANADGVYGTQGVAGTGNVPGSRWGSSGWIDGSGNLWLFGGSSIYESSLNDLWEFNPTAKTWTWVSGSSTPGVIVGVYGTQSIAAANNAPGSRCLAVSWTDSSGNLWLFGGQGYDSTGSVNGDLNDLWKFSPTSKEWTWIGGSSTLGSQEGQPGVYGTLGDPAATNVPGGRDSAVSWTDSSGNFWLFGGESAESFNDLWRYQP